MTDEEYKTLLEIALSSLDAPLTTKKILEVVQRLRDDLETRMRNDQIDTSRYILLREADKILASEGAAQPTSSAAGEGDKSRE